MGQAGREVADHADTGRFAAEQADEDRGHDRDDQGRGYAGRQAAEQLHCDEAEQAGQHRGERSVRQMLQHEPELGEEVAGGAVDAQQMRHLADDGDADEAFDEPAHHRRGDEGRHPAHAQRAEEQEEGADQDREGGGERIEVRRALRRDGAHGQRGDQAGRGVRADDQQARGAEQRVGDQRRDDGVEPHDRRHADDAGIGHALRHHDRPDGEAGQNVRQQPLAPVGGKPAEDGQQPLCDGGRAGRDIGMVGFSRIGAIGLGVAMDHLAHTAGRSRPEGALRAVELQYQKYGTRNRHCTDEEGSDYNSVLGAKSQSSRR